MNIRNNSVYKAEKVSVQKCAEAREFAMKALPAIQAKFEEIINPPEENSHKE